jgi:hypothetical protein
MFTDGDTTGMVAAGGLAQKPCATTSGDRTPNPLRARLQSEYVCNLLVGFLIVMR